MKNHHLHTANSDKLVVLSAKRSEDVPNVLNLYHDFIRPNDHLPGLSHTTLTRKDHFPYRMAFITDSVGSLKKKLKTRLDHEWDIAQGEDDRITGGKVQKNVRVHAFVDCRDWSPVIFEALFTRDQTFKAVIEECDVVTTSGHGFSLKQKLFAPLKRLTDHEYALCSFAYHLALLISLRTWFRIDKLTGIDLGFILVHCLTEQLSIENSLKLAILYQDLVANDHHTEEPMLKGDIQEYQYLDALEDSGLTLSDLLTSRRSVQEITRNGDHVFYLYFLSPENGGDVDSFTKNGVHVDNNHATFSAILTMLGKLFCFGVNIDWNHVSTIVNADGACYITLPPYPLKRKTFFRVSTEKLEKGENLMAAAGNDTELMNILKEQNDLLKEQLDVFKTYIQTNPIVEQIQEERMDTHLLQTEFLEQIIHITGFSGEEISLDQDLFDDLGFDSLMVTDLISALANKYPDIKKDGDNIYVNIYDLEDYKLATILDFFISQVGETIAVADVVEQDSNEEKVVANHSHTPVVSEGTNDFTQFEEYRFFKNRLTSMQDFNPYFKANEGIATDTIRIQGNEYINYTTYNYIGFNGDPYIQEKAKQAIDQYGTSVSGSRLLSGEIPLHRELEGEISSFLGTEDSIVFLGGHTANVNTIGHLFNEDDLVIHDSYSHNSIIQGIIMSGAKRIPFPHNDWRALDQLLMNVRSNYRRVLIVVEGVYSMDGDLVNLPEMIKIRNKFNALLMVDEAHSIGVIGDKGQGVGEYFGVNREHVDLWMGTLSKSFASCGGYISGKKEIIEYLKYSAPGFIFSVGSTPANTAAALAAIRKLRANPAPLWKLRENAKLFLELAKAEGFDTGSSALTPIIPIIIGDSEECVQLSHSLFDQGINVRPIIAPAVDEKAARLRFFITAQHTEDQIRKTVQRLARVRPGKEAVQV